MPIVAVVALDHVVPFDLAVPCEVFGRARLPNGQPAYQVRVCSATRNVDAGPFRLRARWGLRGLLGAHTVILPGISNLDLPIPVSVLRAVGMAASRKARVASICSGAFVLAATG